MLWYHQQENMIRCLWLPSKRKPVVNYIQNNAPRHPPVQTRLMRRDQLGCHRVFNEATHPSLLYYILETSKCPLYFYTESCMRTTTHGRARPWGKDDVEYHQ